MGRAVSGTLRDALPSLFGPLDLLLRKPDLGDIERATEVLGKAHDAGYVDWVGMDSQGFPVYTLTQRMKAGDS